MRYKSIHPESYREGIRNKSFSISALALVLLEENEIDNESAFVNDLIVEALVNKDFFKKRLISQITECREGLLKQYGVSTKFEVTQ